MKYNNINNKNKNNTLMQKNNLIIPVIAYSNADVDKSRVYKDNKNKSGIYRLNNIIDGKYYIGSSVDLARRFSNYYSICYLKNRVKKGSSIIYNALLKYGYSNFSIDILEYCDPESLIKREQYYIDLLKPEYNILPIAGSSLGFKHSPETLLKFKDRKLSSEALTNLKIAKKGYIPSSLLRKNNHLLATGHITTVVFKETNSVKTYSSIRAAARDIGVNHATLINYINTNKLLKGSYMITRKTKD